MNRQYVRFNPISEILLRVPPLFVVDEILKSDFVFPIHSEASKNGSDVSATQITDAGITTVTGTSIIFHMLEFMMTLICCLIAILTVTLNKKQLTTVYVYFISVFILYFSYQRNVIFFNYLTVMETDNETHPKDTVTFYLIGAALIQIMLIQSCLCFAFLFLNPIVLKMKGLSKRAIIIFLSPSVLVLMPFPQSVFDIINFNSSLHLLVILTLVFWDDVRTMSPSIIEGWKFCRRLIDGFGLPALGLVLVKWSKLHLTAVLRIFWIIRLLIHTSNYILENDLSMHEMDASVSFHSWNQNLTILLPFLIQMVKSLLSSGCETFVAVVGMASCLSFIFQQISYIFQKILIVDNRRTYFSMVSGFAFCVFALKFGFTTLVPEKRILYLTRSCLLIFSVLLHMIHKILNSMLVSLSALHNAQLHRHVRALLVSAFIILYPTALIIYYWRSDSTSPWLLGVSAFNLKIIVKMTISLTIYFMYTVNFYRGSFGEKFDDYVYYVDSFGSTIEFCIRIFLFLNGGWLLFYESGSLIRAVLMCAYAYFNLWFVAKTGWSSFMKRRTAAKKIDKLQDATTSELTYIEDVCAICYQSMKAAKITLCRHFFHAICLRKWLYLQDYCPICHRKLFENEES